MKQIKITPLIVCALFVATNCATYRMSEQKQQEITSGPHSILSIKIPNGKNLDGYDEKWKLHISIDGDRFVEDKFSDDETYVMPVKAGTHDVIININRSVGRPFRIAYDYRRQEIFGEKMTFEAGKTTNVTFEIPERKVGVGVIVLGVLLPVVAVVGWPTGIWPNSYSNAKPILTPVTAVVEPPKKKGK